MDTSGNRLWQRVCQTVRAWGDPRPASPAPAPIFVPSTPSPTIDLHGLTLWEAYQAVKAFVAETPHRDVTIITGQGRMQLEVADWLSQCPRYRSHTTLNGGGAFRVRVRV